MRNSENLKFFTRYGNPFSDGPNGFEHPLCLVPVEQGYDCEFLVWNTVQSNVFTLGPLWFQYDHRRRWIYGTYWNLNWASLLLSYVHIPTRLWRSKFTFNATTFLQVLKYFENTICTKKV